MTTRVNPPPQLRIPDKFAGDREIFGYFRQLQTILLQLWVRTGGSDDSISTIELGELYEPGIQTSNADELIEGLEADQSLQGLTLDLLERVRELETDAAQWHTQDQEEMEAFNYDVEVHKGNIPGVSPVNKYGKAFDCDASVSTDVWAGADGVTSTDIFVPPTQARVHQLSSTSANDAAAGTGMRTIRFIYLPNWDTDEVTVDLTLNGLGNVATPACVIINRMEGLTWGSGGVNAGIITATADTDATVTAVIQAGDNQTQQCIYGFPSTKDLLINRADCGIYRGLGVAAQMAGELLSMTDPATNAASNTAWVVKEEIDHVEGSPRWNHVYSPQKKISGPGIVKIQVEADTNNSQVTATIDGYLVDK